MVKCFNLASGLARIGRFPSDEPPNLTTVFELCMLSLQPCFSTVGSTDTHLEPSIPG